MKKLKSSRKLNLSKNTVATLNDSQLEGVNGGGCSRCCTGYSMCLDNPTTRCVSK